MFNPPNSGQDPLPALDLAKGFVFDIYLLEFICDLFFDTCHFDSGFPGQVGNTITSLPSILQ